MDLIAAAAGSHDSVGSTDAGRMEQLADGLGSTPRQADCTTTRLSGAGRSKQSDARDSELSCAAVIWSRGAGRDSIIC
jgi:hypothetical protein